MLVGSLFFDKEHDFSFFSDNMKDFIDSNNEVLTDKELNDWAVWINSPWSQTHESYTISLNCKDSYTAMNSSDPVWKCVYEVIGYDGITSTVVGYGQTEEEALIRCKELFTYLQSNYNKENEAV